MRWWQLRKRDADLERELRSDLELEEGGAKGERPPVRRGSLCRAPRLRQPHADPGTNPRSVGIGTIRAMLARCSLCTPADSEVTWVFYHGGPCACDGHQWQMHPFSAS